MATYLYSSGAELKPFSLPHSFLSACIIIIYTELSFLKKYPIWIPLYFSVGISLSEALYTSESESDTLNNQAGCSYISWALFPVSRYKISCCNRFIVKENSWSFSLTFPFSWQECNLILVWFFGWLERYSKFKRRCSSVPQLGNMDFSLAGTVHRLLSTLSLRQRSVMG